MDPSEFKSLVTAVSAATFDNEDLAGLGRKGAADKVRESTRERAPVHTYSANVEPFHTDCHASQAC